MALLDAGGFFIPLQVDRVSSAYCHTKVIRTAAASRMILSSVPEVKIPFISAIEI